MSRLLAASLTRQHLASDIVSLCAFFISLEAFVGSEMNAEAAAPRSLESTNGAKLNIIRVFNTTLRVWLYQTSQSNVFTHEDIPDVTFKQKCIFNKMINITDEMYHFYRKVNINGNKLTSHYLGQFDLTSQPPISMSVPDLSAKNKSPFEDMKLTYSKGGCSVFEIKLRDEAKNKGHTTERPDCEMYIKKKGGPIDPSDDCKSAYEKTCKTEIYVTYETSCGV
uniref:Lipocalin/cytosolic fatty-acid binding domain-containing protein n=1 Tax=Amblyomma maculatum TaxID=34609 RepID=G3MSN2_AMBMU